MLAFFPTLPPQSLHPGKPGNRNTTQSLQNLLCANSKGVLEFWWGVGSVIFPQESVPRANPCLHGYFSLCPDCDPGVFLPIAEEKRSPVHIAAKIVLGKTAAQAPAALGCDWSLFQVFAHFLSNTALRLLSEGSWIIPNQENMVSYQDRLELDLMITTIEAKPRFDRLQRRTMYKLGERDFGVRINI